MRGYTTEVLANMMEADQQTLNGHASQSRSQCVVCNFGRASIEYDLFVVAIRMSGAADSKLMTMSVYGWNGSY